MLFPGNRNQQHAATCIFLELKWANGLMPNMAYLEKRYHISRRILQRTRAKLSRLGLIEHVSYLNSRYGGQYGWRLSSRFEGALKKLAAKCAGFRDAKTSSKEKDLMLIEFADCAPKLVCPVIPGSGPVNRLSGKPGRYGHGEACLFWQQSRSIDGAAVGGSGGSNKGGNSRRRRMLALAGRPDAFSRPDEIRRSHKSPDTDAKRPL